MLRRSAHEIQRLASNAQASCSGLIQQQSSPLPGPLYTSMAALSSCDSSFQKSAWSMQQRWMAVPKRKISPHRRGLRNQTKYLRSIDSAAKCSHCGAVFQAKYVHFCNKNKIAPATADASQQSPSQS